MRQLTVGFDATPLIGQRSGVGHYTGRLLAAMLDQYPDHTYLLYSNRPLTDLESPLDRAARVESYFERSRWLWMQTILPEVIARTRPDLCHFTNALAPIRHHRPYVLSIHDASLFLYRQFHPPARLLTIRLMLPLAVRRASAVVTMSESARDDLREVLKIPTEKIHVIHEAAPAEFSPISDKAVLASIRERYGLAGPYILYVGTIEPRKNLSRLLRAFARFRRQGFTHDLALVGPRGWSMDGLEAQIAELSLGGAVRLIGYVPERDLIGLYSSATLFVFPSLYEGFGLPPLEAMACGTPVITSNNSSLAEVCDGAACLVEPTDVPRLAEVIAELVADPERRAALSQLGRQRAAEFSWERAARQTMEVYHTVLEKTQ